RGLPKFNPARATAPYALAAMPARYPLERGAWWYTAEPQPASSNFPWTVAMTHFARALGAGRSGNAAAGQADIARITALRQGLKTQKTLYWANEVEVMRLWATAWVTLAQNKSSEALELMRQ